MNPPLHIADTTRLQRARTLAAAELGPDDTVLLDAEASMYYALTGPAGDIWALLGNAPTFAELCEQIAERYDTGTHDFRHDTRGFVAQLVEHGLVEIA